MTIDVTGQISATPTAVWQLLGDSSTWPTWTPLDSHRNVRPAGPGGVGEIREFRNGRYTIREEIVECRPRRRLSYTLLQGLALRDYRADIDLSPRPDGGTAIRWHTTFRPMIRGTGWLYRRALQQATQHFVDGLTQHASSSL